MFKMTVDYGYKSETYTLYKGWTCWRMACFNAALGSPVTVNGVVFQRIAHIPNDAERDRVWRLYRETAA